MKLSAVAVGALIREQINIDKRIEPTSPYSIPIKRTPVIKTPNLPFEDENEVQFEPGSIYLGYEVHGVVKCEVLRKDGNNLYKNGRVYPVKKDKRIIRPSGKTSGMNWEQFHNNYRFEPIVITKKELTTAQKEAKFFRYNERETKRRDNAGKMATKHYHKGVIEESIEHCKYKRNMSVIGDKNIIHNLRESNFWNELDTFEDKTHRFDNITMGSTIWKYKEVWIISSHSAYLKIMTGDI